MSNEIIHSDLYEFSQFEFIYIMFINGNGIPAFSKGMSIFVNIINL